MNRDVIALKFQGGPPRADEIGASATVPLGSRAEVRAAISQGLPEVVWSKPAYGVFNARESRVEFDLGDEDPVAAMAISVHGAGDGTAMLFALAKSRKWSLLDASTGIDLSAGERPSTRVAALMDKQDVAHGEAMAVATAELNDCVARLEDELAASYCQYRSAGYRSAEPSLEEVADIRALARHEKIDAMASLIADLPPTSGSKWRRLLDDTRWFTLVTDVLARAMSVPRDRKAPFSLELRGVPMTLPPMAPVVQLVEAEALLKRFRDARRTIKPSRATKSVK